VKNWEKEYAADELRALMNLKPPTENLLSDAFGLNRDWGKENAWNPDLPENEKYSPIHPGLDFTARGTHKITMPLTGRVWGDFVPGPVGAFCMILPDLCEHIALYLFHCEPTEPEWKEYYQGEYITDQAGYGVGLPHLHFELCVSDLLGRYLRDHTGLLRQFYDMDDHVLHKAKQCKIDEKKTLAAVKQQIHDWGISEIGMNYFVRGPLPEYRQSRLTEVGKGVTWVINPAIFFNGGKSWTETVE
jgi:hypothetical protein